MISKIAGIVETITGFFQSLTQKGYLNLDYIFYIALGLELVLVIFFLIKSSFSYELRLDRSLNKLNKWLYYHQYIDENNLIDFNRRIKKAPKLLKYHWQQYMLYREHEPSYYMSNYNCIDKPMHTSSFTSNIKNLTTICLTLAIVTFVLGLASYALQGVTNIGEVLINCLLTPMAMLLLCVFFSILLRSWQNTNLNGLYQNFHLFNRYIDKACSTMPEYVDFEILFTKDEIRRGIPVLNEFLEKRARQEQKELEGAMRDSVEHEEYNFDELGIDGSQILDRAMKETEIFLNQRQRSLSEIQQLESEIESLKRNYENNQKEYQRKMQASKENVDRLRKQQEESTNRIESNYIRKQQTDEIKKQEQLEKDYEGTTLRYNQELSSLTTEIDARRAELAERRLHVEDAMKAEYKTFSSKMFNLISNDLEEKNKDQLEKLVEEKDTYSTDIQELQSELEDKDNEIQKLHDILKANGIEIGEHGEFYDENLRKEERRVKFGKKNKPEKSTEQIEEIEQTPIDETLSDTEIYAQEQQIDEQIPDVTTSIDEIVYDEYGGYYDNEGYYRYQNGTYYDPEGNYFDQFGGHYDKDGNYYPPQENANEQPADAEQPIAEPIEQPIAEQPVATETIEQPQENLYASAENAALTDEQNAENTEQLVEDSADTQAVQSPIVENTQDIDTESQPKTQENPEVQTESPADDIDFEDFFASLDDEHTSGEQPAKDTTNIQNGDNENNDTELNLKKDTNAESENAEQSFDIESEDDTDQPAQNNITITDDLFASLLDSIEEPKQDTPQAKDDKPQQKSAAQATQPKAEAELTSSNDTDKNVQDEQPQPVAKKRGRPKKTQSDSEKTATTKSTAKRGRPKKTTDDTTAKTPTSTNTAKKRGRPKKSESNTAAATTKPTTSKRGRPKKSATDSAKPATTTKKSSTKKPAAKTTAAKDESKPTAKRGRPKKTQSDSEKSATTKSTAKRGRPKKDSTTKSTTPTTSTGKKRGRPKKQVVTKSELFDELEKLNLQIQEENEKLKNQQQELNKKIDETLSKMEEENKPTNNDSNNVG